MLDIRISSLFRLLAWGYCAYYIYYIAAPNALHLYELFPSLWNLRCGRTLLSWLSYITYVVRGGRILETACCVGSHCVAIANMPIEQAKYRVPRSLDRSIDYWCDNHYYGGLVFGKPEVCHLTLAGGRWEIDISRAFVPTLHGLAMLFLFSYALRHAMARETSTPPAVPEQQVQTPMDVLRVRDSRVSNEVAQDLKKLLSNAKSEEEIPDENVSLPGPNAGSDSLEAYIQSLPEVNTGSAPKRVGPRPRKA